MNLTLVSRGIVEVTGQLRQFLGSLPMESYSASLPVMNGNSIGKHCRHILEGFESLFRHPKGEIINYENRPRQLVYEQDPKAFLQRMDDIMEVIMNMDINRKVLLEHNPYPENGEAERLNSSVGRELLYNLEHMIHHMAIIRIAATSLGMENQMAEGFGVAFSTLHHQKK